MTSYKITTPIKAGNMFLVDIIEYSGFSIIRRTTIRLDQVIPFIRAVFNELPYDYKEKIKKQIEILRKKND